MSKALRLYAWNTEASAAIMAVTAMVEVIVRNALDAQLADWACRRGYQSWLDAAPLDGRGRKDVEKARSRATPRGRDDEVHGKVVAEATLGFWRYLVGQRYHANLWVPALHKAFPLGPGDLRERRRRVDRHLAKLMLVRNRAAHHEPIHRRNLLDDLKAAVDVTAWVTVDAGAWVAGKSTVRSVMDRRP